MRFITVILLAAIAAVVMSACADHLSQDQCTNTSGCSWGETNDSTCQQANKCENLSIVDCLGKSLEQSCYWVPYQKGSCKVKSNACQLKKDGTCTNTTSCKVVPGNDEECLSVGKGFGCENVAQDECQWNPQCSVLNAYCVSAQTCEKQTIGQCDTQNCEQTVSQCKPKANASNTCASLTQQIDCMFFGCVFANNKCVAPSTCTVTDNECDQNVCEVSQLSCTTPSTSCKRTNKNGCKSDFCNWETSKPKCVDNNAYCTIEDCDDKAPFCKRLEANKNPCVPNQAYNQCSALNQDQCTSEAYQNLCEYKMPQEAECIYQIDNCDIYANDNLCNSQGGCSWKKLYACTSSADSDTSKPESSSTNSTILIASDSASLQTAIV